MSALLAAASDAHALTSTSRLLAVLMAGAFIVVVLELIRRHKLQERYTVLWLAAGALMLTVGVFPELLNVPNRLLGIRTPAFALMVLAFLSLLCLVLHLTVAVSRHNEQLTRLAQELAIERAQRQRSLVSETPSSADEDRTDPPVA